MSQLPTEEILCEESKSDLTVALSRAESLHAFFEAQVDARPNGLALVAGRQTLTYAQVDRAANRLARYLRSQGIGRGNIVGILLPRSTDVYVALLAVMKAGAAYVPLDPDYPAERVAYILADCGATGLLTTAKLSAKSPDFGGSLVLVDKQSRRWEKESAARLPVSETGLLANDLCYVIYTSGSTGRPKGVEIEHHSACNFVKAEGELFGVMPTDRVYQGFSIAFDASVEELWLAWYAGATLVVGTREMVQLGPDLARRLTELGVTVFSCVPTLLAIFDDDLPSVRLLILGGEACPQQLVTRWWSPDRRMVNTYGPTEATVVATYSDCHPDKPITIGRPLTNCFALVLDEHMNLVAPGEPGELHLGGLGLARGYVGRRDLTAEKFVADPHAKRDEEPRRLYKTGDLVRWNDAGELEFLGRLDTQVKIRGFRVELAEIETVLLECEGVAAAVVSLREDVPELAQLVAYVVEREPGIVSIESMRAILKARLPSYMIPAGIELIHAFPTLPSGKVDRARLPVPLARPQGGETTFAVDSAAAAASPRTIEDKLTAAWEAIFNVAPIAATANFFNDLGGHSLLAARLVSHLRKDPEFKQLSVIQIYNQPTIADLAESIRSRASASTGKRGASGGQPKVDVRPAFRPVSSRSHFLCGVGQFFSLYPIIALLSIQWLAPYLIYTWMIDNDHEYIEAIVVALIGLIATYPVMLLVSIAVKWMVIGRYRAGEYPLWGWYYLRFWFVRAIQQTIPISYLCGTPLLPLYYRALGAKIGENVFIGTDGCFVHDLLSIGDDASIGTDASLAGYRVEGGLLHIGPITIGERCYVGTRSIVREYGTLGNEAKLEDLSMLPRGGQIAPGHIWSGSPARPIGITGDDGRAVPRPGKPARVRRALLHVVGLCIFPTLVAAAIFPGMIVMNELNYADEYYYYLVWSPAIALSFIVLLCLEIAAFKWVLLGHVRPGRYSLGSSFYLKKWFVDQLMELSLDVLGPLYATIYLNPWYRLLGAKVGKRAEISTASFISPDLLEIDDEGFIADAVSLGAPRIEDGTITVARVRIGARSFIGNSALLPPGTTVGANCLVGCLSTLPPDGAAATDDTAWLGSPAFFLPQRQKSTTFVAEKTFVPTRSLWIQRAVIEFFRITLPTTGFISLTSILFSIVLVIRERLNLFEVLIWFPVLYGCAGIVAASITILLKWILMGRYVPTERPLWHNFVWRNELITALCEGFAGPFIVHMLEGTPMACWFFRAMGAKIGKRVYMGTADLTEFDLVRIGDDSALNQDATVQTHLFEDRVMKMSYCDIGARCTVGELSLVLYDTKMEDGAALDDLSLLMKGETLPANTAWQGIPATSRRGGV